MKKIFFTLVIAVLIAPVMFSFDWGGSISNYSYITNEEDSWEQINMASLWVSHKFNNYASLEGQSYIGYAKDEYDFIADLDYLYFEQIIPKIFGDSSALSYKLGRFYQAEFSGKVFAHRADGFLINLGIKPGNLYISTGYTGLLLKPNSRLKTTNADIADDNDDDIYFAPKKLISVIGFEFMDILPGQNLEITGTSVFDLRNDNLIKDGDTLAEAAVDGNTGGKFNTFYIGTAADGSISSNIFYDLYGYLQLGKILTVDGSKYKNKAVTAFLTGADLKYFNRNLLYSQITASFLYASGDDDAVSIYEGNTSGKSTNFIPVSETSKGFIFAPKLSNIMTAGLEYSIKPFGNKKSMLSNIQVILGSNMFFRATKGAISEQQKINTSSDKKYLGTEIDLGINLRPSSDFGIVLKGGAFIPPSASDSAINTDSNDPEYGGSINLSFSF